MLPSLYLSNTLTRAKEQFRPIAPAATTVYACGPTVYHYAHVGNLRAYVSWDILTKTLRRFGYPVRYAMNITDVGHLTSDGDDGEDKMIVAMRREGKSPWDIAKFYEQAFFDDCAAMNIARPDIVCRATEHIPEMIAMIERLQANGYTYVADGNVYYDTARWPSYGALWGGRRTASAEHARVDTDSAKRNPTDFVLWFGNSKFKDQAMKWESPWGVGHPGWHIECSAMAIKYLGEQIDIHCGGADHISVHHTNEIAQSEGSMCACGQPSQKKWVNTWLHNEFILDSTGKMSKSKGDFLTLAKLKEEGISPMAYRLFVLGGHYRSQIALSWDTLRANQNAYDNLAQKLQEWEAIPAATDLSQAALDIRTSFDAALADDLNTPVALACLWTVIKDTALDIPQKKALLADFDTVLGLGSTSVKRGELTPEQQQLLAARAAARAAKEWQHSDKLRDELAVLGILVKDTPSGQEWTRK